MENKILELEKYIKAIKQKIWDCEQKMDRERYELRSLEQEWDTLNGQKAKLENDLYKVKKEKEQNERLSRK